MKITWLKIPTGRRQTSWLFTKRVGSEFAPPKTNPFSGRKEDLNPGPPAYRSSARTSRPRSPPCERGQLVNIVSEVNLLSSYLPWVVKWCEVYSCFVKGCLANGEKLTRQLKLLWVMVDFRPRGGGGGVTRVNFCWVCAAGLSEPLPHYSLFRGQL